MSNRDDFLKKGAIMLKDKWTQDIINQVWSKGEKIYGYDPRKYRKDMTGAWMEYSKYGTTGGDCSLGWEIDHRKPEAKGGSNELFNLRPLQWRNNRAKGDNFPRWVSVVSSERGKNVPRAQNWIINTEL